MGAVVEVKNQDGVYQEATINKLTDASIYTVGMFSNTISASLSTLLHSSCLFLGEGFTHSEVFCLKEIFREPSSIHFSEKVKNHVISPFEMFLNLSPFKLSVFFSDGAKFRENQNPKKTKRHIYAL